MRRLVLFIAGGLGIVVLAGGILLYVNREKIARFGIDRTLHTIESQMTMQVTSPARLDSVKSDFATLHRRLQEGSVTAADARDFAALFYTSTRDDRLDSAETRLLTDRLRTLTGSH
jgi:hypothetical protein